MTLLPEHAELEGLDALLRQTRRWGLVDTTPAHLDLLARQLRADGSGCAVDVFLVIGEALSRHGTYRAPDCPRVAAGE